MTRVSSLRSRTRELGVAALAAALLAGSISCDSTGLTDSLSDRVPPTVSLAPVAGGPDSLLTFSAHVADNLGILNVHVTVAGGVTGVFDTTFNTANTSIDLPYAVLVPPGVPLGTTVTVIGVAQDGAHNMSAPDTLLLATGNTTPALVRVTSPTSADTSATGFTLPITIAGSSPNDVKILGYSTSGALATSVQDSTIFPSDSLTGTATTSLTLDLTGASAGSLTITPFLVDSTGARVLGPAVTVTITTTAPTNTIPTVTFGITDRIEVSDTIHVKGVDRAGIRYVGYRVNSIGNQTTCGAFSVADSLQIAGNVNPVDHTFTMSLPVTGYPCLVEVRGFARNQYGTLGEAPTAGAPALLDTVTVVAGLTRSLAQGGIIADAIFHKASDKLYLTNIEKNEVEVFSLADQQFHTPIPVGSRPWGITVWPRDRDGNQGDTLLVANSGGTNISYIDVNKGSEVYRYPLPNFGVYTVASVTGPTGTPIRQMTQHEFSDRPQFVAATCRGAATPGTPCGDVILVYSTTPTPTQTAPFPERGSLRWEDLTNHSSHFFFEQAQGQAQGRSDTLVVERIAAGGVGQDSVLVPFQDTATAPDGSKGLYSVVVDIDKLAFRDTTFVRNSGNFARAIFGEGGPARGSRALMYDATAGLEPTVTDINGGVWTLQRPIVDGGVSRPEDVSDVIGNTATNISGASINFDGSLAAIRGDSTYLIDPTLRLQGLLQTSGGSPGFDFHPQNSAANAGDVSKRVAFAASEKPEIQVYDTYFYSQICQPIPIRDPIIGPIKATIRASTGDLVLVGATANGVVIVTLPSNFTSTCAK